MGWLAFGIFVFLHLSGSAEALRKRSGSKAGKLAETTQTTTWYNDDQNEVGKNYDTLVAALPSLAGKCVAITGTTSGIGYWSAVATARKGASCLIMLNRPSERAVNAESQVKSYAAEGVQIFAVDCDLMDLASVRRAAASVEEIASRFGGLDVLVNNAGVMNTPDERSVDGFDTMMQTNLYGHWVLLKDLMPLLKRTAASREVRVVMQSSLVRSELALLGGGGPPDKKYYLKSDPGSLGGDFWGKRERYHQSKMAHLFMAVAMHKKLAAAGIANLKSIAVAPGFARTHLDMPPLTDFAKRLLKDGISQSASDGACPLLLGAFDPTVQSGDFYEPDGVTKGPAKKLLSEGVVVKPVSTLSWALGIRDEKLIADENLENFWAWAEEGLGERFEI